MILLWPAKVIPCSLSLRRFVVIVLLLPLVTQIPLMPLYSAVFPEMVFLLLSVNLIPAKLLLAVFPIIMIEFEKWRLMPNLSLLEQMLFANSPCVTFSRRIPVPPSNGLVKLDHAPAPVRMLLLIVKLIRVFLMCMQLPGSPPRSISNPLIMYGFSGEPSPDHPFSRAVAEKLASPLIFM